MCGRDDDPTQHENPLEHPDHERANRQIRRLATDSEVHEFLKGIPVAHEQAGYARCETCKKVLLPTSDAPGEGEANYGCGCDWTFTCVRHTADPDATAGCTEHPLVIASFTGTQVGMSQAQKDRVRLVLENFAPHEVHHGDCTGSDDEFDDIARELGIRVVVHPPEDPKKRAFVTMHKDKLLTDKVRPLKPYLDRNHDIVDEGTFLIATPETNVEQLRSGTWATVRYARRVSKRIELLPR